MPINGEYGSWSGPLTPSTEWRFHLDILPRSPRRRGDRAFSSDLLLRAGDAEQADSCGPLHDRIVWRADRQMHQVRAFRHEGARRPRRRGTWRPSCGAARQSRRADDRARLAAAVFRENSRISRACTTTRLPRGARRSSPTTRWRVSSSASKVTPAGSRRLKSQRRRRALAAQGQAGAAEEELRARV